MFLNKCQLHCKKNCYPIVLDYYHKFIIVSSLLSDFKIITTGSLYNYIRPVLRLLQVVQVAAHREESLGISIPKLESLMESP